MFKERAFDDWDLPCIDSRPEGLPWRRSNQSLRSYSVPRAFGDTRAQNHVNMTLEDFERSLLEGKQHEDKVRSRSGHDERRRHHGHHKHHPGEDHHRHKRRRYSSREKDDKNRRKGVDSPVELKSNGPFQDEDVTPLPTDGVVHTSSLRGQIQRDSWMEEPSGLDIDYTQKGVRQSSQPIEPRSKKADFELKIHENELNKHHLQNLADGEEIPEELAEEPSHHEVDYHFGDSGSQWRMTKLKGVYRRADETGRPVDDVAEEQFGDLRAFDDAREEQIELERRITYGEGYVGKEKPSGELFEERKLKLGLRRDKFSPIGDHSSDANLPREVNTGEPATATVPLNQTDLNRLKAQMLKAKVRGSSDAVTLEARYNDAMADFEKNKQPDVVVLGAMDSRMLAGSRKGEIISIDNKRGRERGLVEENEDMSIEDMVKQERRTQNQAGGDGQRFAERIVKDAKFDVRGSHIGN